MDHALSNLALPALGTLKPIRLRLIVHQGLVDLLLCVQDKGAVLDDFLIEWQTRYEDCCGIALAYH
jgi:hypothetical protein